MEFQAYGTSILDHPIALPSLDKIGPPTFHHATSFAGSLAAQAPSNYAYLPTVELRTESRLDHIRAECQRSRNAKHT